MENVDTDLVHKNFIRKFIEELQFEEVLPFHNDKNGSFYVEINKTTKYKFEGKIGIWNNIQIDVSSITKIIDSEIAQLDPIQMIIEFNQFMKMDDQTLALFISEAHNTLYSDYQQERLYQGLNFKKLIEAHFNEIDPILPGHPKLLLNKGRIGWSCLDLKKFAPEFNASFKLIWLAVKKNQCQFGFSQDLVLENLYLEALGESELKNISSKVNLEEYVLLPVHPWQWNNIIEQQYFQELINGNIIHLGSMGKSYSAQISLRTLSSSEASHDLKLPLSILNTSCVRGIPKKYIPFGHELSSKLESLIKNDPLLVNLKTNILRENVGVYYPNPYFEQIKNCSYRFHEYLGAVWRETVTSKLKDNQKAIPLAALSFNHKNQCLINEYIKESKLEAIRWIERLFHHVIIPLYHLQHKYGLGLVAHGQNIIVILENNTPSGVILKDFHGDLRISEGSQLKRTYPFDQLDQLPSHYLIHDLITGNLVTVMRYISRVLNDFEILTEELFYNSLAKQIQSYNKEYGIDNHDPISLLQQHFEKVLVNSVRFIAGYDETSTRLKPLLGTKILNPLALTLETKSDL